MKKKFFKILFSLCFSILSMISIIHITHYQFFTYLYIFIILSFLFYFLPFKKGSKRTQIYAFIFSFLFCLFQIIGYNCFQFDSAYLSHFDTYFYTFLLIPFIYFITLWLFQITTFKNKEFSFLKRLFSNKYRYFIIFFMIFLSWIPILISFYPGNFSYDAATQLRMVQNHVITKYHPVIHTLFLGGSILFGKNLFSSFSIGIFIYSILQMIIMASIFTYMIIYLDKKKVPYWLNFIFLIIFMFLPTHSIFSFTTTKDIIFSGLFCLVMIQFIEMSHHPKDFFDKKRQIVTTIFFIFLLLIFRNNMLYAFIFFIPYSLFVLRSYYKKLLIIFISSLLLYSSYQGILSYIFKIENGPRVEAFSVVVQQLARTYHKQKLSSRKKQLIENLFQKKSLDLYHSHIADPIKSNFQTDVFLNHKKEYFNLYLSLLKKYPTTYLDSFLDTIYPYFYLGDVLPDKGARTYIEITCLDTKSFNRTYQCHQNFKPIYQRYNKLLNDATYQQNPLLYILMNMSTYVWFLIFVCFYLLQKKKYRSFLPCLLLLGLFLTNLLGPVAIVRYIYPIMVTTPLLFYLILYKEN